MTNLKRQEPYFDPNVNQNVTALVGKSAYLNCIVKNLGNKTVEFNSLEKWGLFKESWNVRTMKNLDQTCFMNSPAITISKRFP